MANWSRPAISTTSPTATSWPRWSTPARRWRADGQGLRSERHMQLTNIAIRRPLFMLMAIGALLVVGAVSWTKLGVDLLPALDFPIVVVSTPFPGASPEAVDTLVTKRVEDAVASINDIDYIQSTSVQGVSTVIIFFTDKPARDSSIDVERKVAAIRGRLPTDVKDPT